MVVIDYGAGNLFSIERAIDHIGGDTEVTCDPKKVANAERLLLPGVGAFQKAMCELAMRDLVEPIRSFAKTGRPLLGICLGMQLLMTEGTEDGQSTGLNIIKGKVVRFRGPVDDGEKFKIPHVGWNRIEFRDNEPTDGPDWSGALLEGIERSSYFYFVHSYIVVPENTLHNFAETHYGADRFCSVVGRDNIWGTQFHPEKSAEKGLKIFRNFIFNL